MIHCQEVFEAALNHEAAVEVGGVEGVVVTEAAVGIEAMGGVAVVAGLVVVRTLF